MNLSLHDSMLVIVSTLVTAACFNIMLYFGYRKKKAYLFFAFYCLFHCFKIYLKRFPAEQLLFAGLSTYELVYLSVILGMLSLSTFLAYYFDQPHKKPFIITYVILSLLLYFSIHEMRFIPISLVVASAQTIYATIKNRHALIVLLGLFGFSFCVILGTNDILNYGYFVGVIVLVFFMAMATSIRLARQNKHYENAILRSSRLENQLLKTTIQPHFILNSLTSLQELIEEDPELASEFVENLSTEFALFSKISAQELISVSDELAIVKAYLNIMSIRKSTTFNLTTKHLSPDDQIPPGIFLTLIENGITHGYENQKTGSFVITKEQYNDSKIFKIFNDGAVEVGPTKIGIGLNYVVARLQETYGNKFKFDTQAKHDGWLSTITIWT